MLRRAFSIAALLSVAAFGQQARIGKPASEDKIKAMDITVFPDGRGLPAGSGTAAKGKDIFKEKCAVCHNDQGQGREGQYPALVGGKGTINTPKPVKTVGSYWPYATTVFDYIRRAMPYDQPGTHRRVLFSDLLAYLDQQRLHRRAALDRMTEDAGEAGLYGTRIEDYAAALKKARKRAARPGAS